jgi:hypothetical protein
MTANNDSRKVLNRLRAAAGLIPIIESALAKSQMTAERTEKMCRFCSWSLEAHDVQNIEVVKLKHEVQQGLERICAQLELQKPQHWLPNAQQHFPDMATIRLPEKESCRL